MTVYFTASIAGKREYLPNYQTIIATLRNKNIGVIADHILNTEQETIFNENREELVTFHRKLTEWITHCDWVVAETSYPSISIGYEISLALHHRKPVLALYSGKNPPSLFIHTENDNLLCEKYTLQTLPKIIDTFKNYIEGINDSRMTFFLNSRQTAHLNKISREKKIPKSVYLRQLIEHDIKKSP